MTIQVNATRTAGSARAAQDAEARALLSLLADLPAGPDRDRVRGRVIELYLPLAQHLAGRFRNRGEQLDDLLQVATVGLIKAVDGFDPDNGAVFVGYAIPTITGELKRHFRDRCWDVRVPRRIQENRLRVMRVTGELTQRLGRSPTVADLAAELETSEEDVIEALDAGRAYRSLSLDAPANTNESDGPTDLSNLLGADDADMEQVETREALRPLLARLPEREQKIIAMRFFGNRTQSQIAAELGVSQMHISRLLTKALATLRTQLTRG
ncbi:RNA polymerase sigma factor SigF [Dactylosporangium vinaceum]|uniref:RNA polymerase sigma factor SigF n=1 Tax=Dactylosporangium vinaceum TaxID=53362 RepID=A0ABV5MEH5_9ACTN|nr:RNA polymerase sigma factor SigF [Dactylosporangium vinaceum]UAB92402.1 RNA polymerase sigma factor SigF [Dactylosporangium vinaceum]